MIEPVNTMRHEIVDKLPVGRTELDEADGEMQELHGGVRA